MLNDTSLVVWRSPPPIPTFSSCVESSYMLPGYPYLRSSVNRLLRQPIRKATGPRMQITEELGW